MDDVRDNHYDGFKNEKGDHCEKCAHCLLLLLDLDDAEGIEGDLSDKDAIAVIALSLYLHALFGICAKCVLSVNSFEARPIH